MKAVRFLLTLGFLGVSMSSALPAQNVGALVGLSAGDTLRTVWLVARSGSSPVEIPGLVIPRRDGFWRAGIESTCMQFAAIDTPMPGYGTFNEQLFLGNSRHSARRGANRQSG